MEFKSAEEIKDFLIPYAEREKVELVDVEVKKGKDSAITVFIDTEDGVDLDTLEGFITPSATRSTFWTRPLAKLIRSTFPRPGWTDLLKRTGTLKRLWGLTSKLSFLRR